MHGQVDAVDGVHDSAPDAVRLRAARSRRAARQLPPPIRLDCRPASIQLRPPSISTPAPHAGQSCRAAAGSSSDPVSQSVDHERSRVARVGVLDDHLRQAVHVQLRELRADAGQLRRRETGRREAHVRGRARSRTRNGDSRSSRAGAGPCSRSAPCRSRSRRPSGRAPRPGRRTRSGPAWVASAVVGIEQPRCLGELCRGEAVRIRSGGLRRRGRRGRLRAATAPGERQDDRRREHTREHLRRHRRSCPRTYCTTSTWITSVRAIAASRSADRETRAGSAM